MDKMEQINENKFIYSIAKKCNDFNVYVRDKIITRNHKNFALFLFCLISILISRFEIMFITIPILFILYLNFVKIQTINYYTYMFKFFGLLTNYEYKNTYKVMKFKDKLLIKNEIIYYFESNLTLQELQNEIQKIESVIKYKIVDISHFHKNNNVFIITAVNDYTKK